MSQMLRIFVSHAHEDNAWCREFVEVLMGSGADVWYDEQDMGYDTVMEEVNRQLQARPIFIVVLSPASITSPWVNLEMAAAVRLKHKEPARIILPVVARDCNVPPLLGAFRSTSAAQMTKVLPQPKRREACRTYYLQRQRLLTRFWPRRVRCTAKQSISEL